MTRNKYLLLGSSLSVLLLLIVAAFQENFRKEWRLIQKDGRSEEGAISVQLRQIVNPVLGVSDRCVSCHVSMGPADQGVSGAKILVPHKPVVHDVAEYGCTVCHAGQGLATDKADAHGDVHFWPAPMIPVRYSEAGCGTCHAALGIPNRGTFEKARGAFERLDCLACHRMDGRGGTIRPDGGGMEGPDLSRAGLSGYDADWYAKHLHKSSEAPDRAWKMSFAPISDRDHELLGVFLSTRVGAPKLVEAKAVFHSSGCLGCHKLSGVGGDEGPDLSRAGEKDPGQLNFSNVPGKATVAAFRAEHLRSPSSVVAGSLMPALGLAERDVDLLTMYVLSLRRGELPASYLPKDRVRVARFGEREFASDGATIYGTFCAGCHGLDGMGLRSPGMAAFPSIANPDFLELAPDEFLTETVRQGRPGRRMPAWSDAAAGLKPDEITAVVSHVRRLGGVVSKPETLPRRWVAADVSLGGRLYAASCAGCHGARGEGGEGPALNNKVLLSTATDTYLIETIARGRRGTAMNGFAQASPVHRSLASREIEAIVSFVRTWQGGKL